MVDGHLVNVEADDSFDVHRAIVVRYAGEGHRQIADVAFPPFVPDWTFDPKRFGSHSGEAVPGFHAEPSGRFAISSVTLKVKPT